MSDDAEVTNSFRYSPDENVVEVSFYIEPASEDLSGSHSVEVVEPGEDYYGIPFEALKQAKNGVLTVAPDKRSARISSVFKGRGG
ncbi:MAG: hypothetical protein KI792_09730 [Alphaproteobacteria bacterium]|nr:hypothetical protein [Alphaproteobacteria bacterium SS10]